MCPGGMAEMQITIWGHRLGFRCLAVFGVGGLQVITIIYVAGWCHTAQMM